MSYLDSLRVFVRIVARGSISAGGRDLRLTPAAASNRIKDLESRFGVRLLNRTTRKLAPTEIGAALYENARKVIAALDETEAMLASYSGTPQGVLRLVAPLGLGRRLIAPIVLRFCEDHPEIQIRLRLSDRAVNIVEEGIDVAFFLGQPEDFRLELAQDRGLPSRACRLAGLSCQARRAGLSRRPDGSQLSPAALSAFAGVFLGVGDARGAAQDDGRGEVRRR